MTDRELDELDILWLEKAWGGEWAGFFGYQRLWVEIDGSSKKKPKVVKCSDGWFQFVADCPRPTRDRNAAQKVVEWIYQQDKPSFEERFEDEILGLRFSEGCSRHGLRVGLKITPDQICLVARRVMEGSHDKAD